jgi:predicted small lipoprotein YifL
MKKWTPGKTRRKLPAKQSRVGIVKPLYLLLLIIAFLITGCGRQATPTLYIPPTQISTPVYATQVHQSSILDPETPTAPPQPTPSPDCTPGLVFLEDLTIPDGSSVNPGELLDKRWLVENIGSCNWDNKFSLRLIAGPELGAPPENALFPARSGTQVEIRILFTAPQEPATYRSAWQAHDPQGKTFGDPIFIEFVVANP